MSPEINRLERIFSNALAKPTPQGRAAYLDEACGGDVRPFFVRELVKGVPITQYCDEKNFAVRARLELFVQVCQAVQHAHQKGIIQRDIKPSNVLVATHDGHPLAKVIDFGIAKATQ